MATAAISIVCSVFILSIHYHDSKISPPRWLVRYANTGTSICNVRKCNGKSEKMSYIASHLPAISATIKPYAGIKRPQVQPIEVNSYSTNQTQVFDGDNSTPFHQILGYLLYIVSRFDDKESDYNIHKEWKAVAKAIDRALFKLVSGMLVVMAIVVLGFMPLTKTWPVLNIQY